MPKELKPEKKPDDIHTEAVKYRNKQERMKDIKRQFLITKLNARIAKIKDRKKRKIEGSA